MGCFSDREKGPPSEEAKWTYITLSDFRCTSAWTVVAYAWLWFLAGVGVAVYIVDTYTAVNLLAFNHWSSQVQPKLDFKYSKWIFAVCILLSWALFIYEFIRAIRVMKRGGVAESFLDPLAVNIQSMRQRGWKRFLVFTELTSSKKGADYVALFVYFSFKNALRVILAEGPRQVVNGLTLYAVMEAQLLPGSTVDDSGADRNNFDQFWFNVQTLADQDKRQAVVYFSMLFTLCIWVFSALSLIISFVMYIFFLWHYIPQKDGRLSAFCKRKVDKRLAKIVEHKVRLGIENEQREADKAVRKAELQRKKSKEQLTPVPPAMKKQPTLPDIGFATELSREKQSQLSRQDTSATATTLPPYSAQSSAIEDSRQPTLPRLVTGPRPGAPSRAATQSSAWSAAPSYSTDAPLLANEASIGQSDPSTPYDYWSQPPFDRHQDYAGTPDDYQRAYTPVSDPRMRGPNSAGFYNTGGRFAGARPAPQWSSNNLAMDQDFQSTRSVPPRQTERQYPPPVRSYTADAANIVRAQSQQSNRSLGDVRVPQGPRSFSRPMPPTRSATQTPTHWGEAPRTATPPVRDLSQAEVYELQPQRNRASLIPQQHAEYVAFKPATPSIYPSQSTNEPPPSGSTASKVVNQHLEQQDSEDSGDRLRLSQPDTRNSNYANDILEEYRPFERSSGAEVSPPRLSEDRGLHTGSAEGERTHSQGTTLAK